MKHPGSKGKSWVFRLDLNGTFSAAKVEPGFLVKRRKMDPLNDLLFIECRNFTNCRPGYLCAISEDKLFTKYDNGIYLNPSKIHLCLFRGFTLSSDQSRINIAIKKLKSGSSISPISGNQKFLEDNFFESTTRVLPTSKVDAIFLNQIDGPVLNGWVLGKPLPNSSIEFVESKKCPDLWGRRGLDIEGAIKLKQPFLAGDCSFHRKQKRKRKHNRPYLTEIVQRTNPSVTVIYCVSKNIDQSYEKKKYHLVEYPASDPKSSTIMFAPLTSDQVEDLKEKVANQPGGVIKIEAFRSAIDAFVEINGLCLLSLQDLKMSKSVPCLIVSLIKEEEVEEAERTIGLHFQGGIASKVMDRNMYDFDVPMGVVVFRGYAWPYRNSLSTGSLEIVSQCFRGKGLNRSCTEHSGNFEMVGKRLTNMASGSMSCPPGRSKEHSFFRNNTSMQRSLLPMARAVVNKLVDEAYVSQFSSGDVLMNLLSISSGEVNRKEICPYMILTSRKFHNTVHSDKDFMTREDTQKVFSLLDQYPDHRQHYKQRVQRIVNCNRLPKATTCCWTIVLPLSTWANYDFEHRQFFALLGLGLAFNISSSIMQILEQIGATFYASTFSHCSTIPIWIDWEAGVVKMCDEKFYNTAWGSNGTG